MLNIVAQAGTMLFRVFCLSCIFCTSLPTSAQRINEYLGNESLLYAETKQINQFLRRFNCEESPYGKRYYPGDSLYHNRPTRDKYLKILFDLQNRYLTDSLKQAFIKDVNGTGKPKFLDFYGDDWFAEVKAQFIYQGKPQSATLFLKLQKEEVGHKWVFSQAYFEPFKLLFSSAESVRGIPPFIHPQSHELDFMNLHKVFLNKQQVELYASKEYQPDHLTLFLYEIKRGNLKFVTVEKVKFHFLQIENWYFELTEFVRNNNNRGWLISQLVKVPEDKKDVLLKYIYHD